MAENNFVKRFRNDIAPFIKGPLGHFGVALFLAAFLAERVQTTGIDPLIVYGAEGVVLAPLGVRAFFKDVFDKWVLGYNKKSS